MARYDNCIQRLIEAAGRQLTDREVEAIFERIHKAALDIKAGRVDPADVKLDGKLGKEMAADGIIQEAAQRAAADLVKEAETRERQAALQITKIAARGQDAFAAREAGLDPLEAVKRVLTRDYSGKVNIESLEQRVAGVKGDLERKLLKTWDALGNDFLGFFQDQEKLLNLVKELRGDDTGDSLAKQGAKAFHDVAEEARQIYNANGGVIGKLDDWGMPQHHSQEKVSKASEILTGQKTDSPEANRKAWVDYMLPKLLGGEKYVDDLGRPWDETRMREFLDKAWTTVATDGIANMQIGGPSGSGKRANRHSESRQIHFKNADDVIDYWQTFGDKSAVEILHGHIETMAKDIAFIEKLGPNPDMTYRVLRDQAVKDAAIADPQQTETINGRASRLDALYDYAAGKIRPSANATFSSVMDGIGALNSAGKLGGAMLASLFGDKPMYEAVSHLNNIPAVQRWQAEISMLNPANAADRRLLAQQGLMAESIRSGLNRFYEGLGASSGASQFASTTSKIANAVMRVTGMTAINDLRKSTFGLNLYSAIGEQLAAGKEFKDLHESDVRALKNYGITEADWGIWKQAQLEDMKVGSTVLKGLTPESIARIPGLDEAAKREAIVKLLGAVNTESDFAIVTPGWSERAQFYSGLAGQRGTVMGEIARSVLQFKSFPWAMFQRSLDLVANGQTPASKAALSAWVIVSTTLAGAMLMQTREILAGKDPRKMNDDRDWWKFWGQAFLQGGALGIYGDFLYGANQTRYGSGPLETMAGPTIGPLLELGIVQPMNAAKKQIEGKQTHLAAEELQDLKGFIPGGNIWYAKAALDHLIFHQVFDYLSPGYLANMQSRTLKDYQQDWWWKPGEVAPERAPDFSRAVAR